MAFFVKVSLASSLLLLVSSFPSGPEKNFFAADSIWCAVKTRLQENEVVMPCRSTRAGKVPMCITTIDGEGFVSKICRANSEGPVSEDWANNRHVKETCRVRDVPESIKGEFSFDMAVCQCAASECNIEI